MFLVLRYLQQQPIELIVYETYRGQNASKLIRNLFSLPPPVMTETDGADLHTKGLIVFALAARNGSRGDKNRQKMMA